MYSYDEEQPKKFNVITTLETSLLGGGLTCITFVLAASIIGLGTDPICGRNFLGSCKTRLAFLTTVGDDFANTIELCMICYKAV
jgi:hypothetical protein